jgi:hypothetical protein
VPETHVQAPPAAVFTVFRFAAIPAVGGTNSDAHAGKPIAHPAPARALDTISTRPPAAPATS